jgi:hypothetical protein
MVEVSCANLAPEARQITILYEGEITSTRTSVLVSDPIRFVKPASE